MDDYWSEMSYNKYVANNNSERMFYERERDVIDEEYTTFNLQDYE